MLEEQLQEFGLLRAIKDQGELDQECNRLTSALQTTIQKKAPTTKLCPKSKRWWTKELTQLCREASKLRRKASKLRDDPNNIAHAESAKAKKAYERTIEFNKKHHWRDWLEKVIDPDIWTAHRYISAPALDGSTMRISTLTAKYNGAEVTASTNEEKSRVLARTFFPAKPPDEAQ
jgi:hypothetical protein